MNFLLTDFIQGSQSGRTTTYPVLQSKCLDMTSIPDGKVGDIVGVVVSPTLGVTHTLTQALLYGDKTAPTVTYICEGTTFNYDCITSATPKNKDKPQPKPVDDSSDSSSQENDLTGCI